MARDLKVVVTGDITGLRRALGGVPAETKKAEDAVSRMQRQIHGKFEQVGHDAKHIRSEIGKHALGIGASFTSIAGAAAGLEQSVASVETLAKGTALLTRTTGLDTKTASEWVQVARLRGVQAQQLNMGFITLSKQLTAAADGSKKSVSAFKQLGVAQDEIKRGNVNEILHSTADAFERMPAGANRAALAQQLFGRQSRVLTQLLADGSKGLDNNLRQLDEYGAALDKNGIGKVKQTIEAQHRLELAWAGIETTLGTALLPMIAKGATGIAHFVKQMRDGTGPGGKFVGTLKSIRDAVAPVVRFLGQHPQLIKVAIGGWVAYKTAVKGAMAVNALKTFAGLFTRSVPVAGAEGVAAGRAYAAGFAEGSGGVGAIGGAAGGAAGAARGAAGAAEGVGAGAAAGGLARGAGLLSRLRPALGKAGAAAATADVVLNLVNARGNPIVAGINSAHDMTFGIVPKVKYPSAGSRISAQLKGEADQLDRLEKSRDWKALDAFGDKTRAMARDAATFKDQKLADEENKIADAAVNAATMLNAKITPAFDQMRRDLRGNWHLMESDTSLSLKRIRSNVASNTSLIKQRLGKDTADGRRALSVNFREAADAVQTQMNRGKVSTREGTAQIKHYLVSALKSLGLSGSQASAQIDNGTLQGGSARTPGQGLAPTRAGGGWIGARGMRGRDEVPIVVGAGEAVLNRHQQSVVEGLLGNGFLDRLFATVQTPHYMAAGGHVRPVGADTPALRFAGGGTIPRVTVNLAGAVGAEAQRAVNIDRNAALQMLAAAYGSGAGGGASSTTGLVPQVKRALAWARGHGWGGSVTSGFRSYAEQAALYARYLAGGNLAAPPGQSNHEFGRAVDVTDIPGFQRAMASAPPADRLLWFGPADPVHFSVDGHARGGRVRRYASGGRVHGRVSTFGPPLEGAGRTASGASSAAPGIAIYNRSTLGKLFDVTIGGHHATLRQTDIGPAPWTGRVIDVTGAGARALGINPAHFPTDSIGTAVLHAIGRGGSGGSRPVVTGSHSQSTRGPAGHHPNLVSVIGRVDAEQAGFDQSDTNFANRQTIAGIDSGSAQGLQGTITHEEGQLGRLYKEVPQLVHAYNRALRTGNRRAARKLRRRLHQLNNQILQQSADIVGLQGNLADAAPDAPDAPTGEDLLNADLSLAQLNDDQNNPATLKDNLGPLQALAKYHRDRMNYALAVGNKVVAGQEADSLKSTLDSISSLTDAINANTNAIKQQQADLATELKRQNDFQKLVYGSQTTAILKGIVDFANGQIGGTVGLGAMTPSYSGGRVRY